MKNQLDKNNFVYSTNPNFEFEIENDVVETLSANKQLLRVVLDTKMRAGKKVTLITGFIGTENDLESLSKTLKTKLGVGGSTKNQEIIIQGDYVLKVKDILKTMNYKVK